MSTSGGRRRMRHALLVLLAVSLPTGAAAAGDPNRGQQMFARACAACHSLKPDANMTGPSLSGLWNRKAGHLPSFHRYSPAMKAADVTWGDDTLDAWIADPALMIPGNRMPF